MRFDAGIFISYFISHRQLCNFLDALLPERTRDAQLNLLPVVALAMSALQPEWWRPRLQEDFVAILQ